jgi:DNA processing protein
MVRLNPCIDWIAAFDDRYPASLRDLAHPPAGLFAIGDTSALTMPRISIVGTRRATSYGLRVARSLAMALARSGIAVVSGLARGIDAAVHRAVLEADGVTIAVLGTGIDVPYPVNHRELHASISRSGLVLSEHGSGVRANKGAFPRRNRIIAALSPVTIVVEAPDQSGALNTAEWALDLGRTVACVPGPIDSPSSAGSNRLMRDGATIILSFDDVYPLAGVIAKPTAQRIPSAGHERAVWDALEDGPIGVDNIASRAGLAARECLVAITALEIQGLVEGTHAGDIRRR